MRNEIRLFTSELATDLARFPVLREWTTDDLQMLAGLLVNTMIATVGAMVDAPVAAPEAEAEIARVAEKQLRLTLLGVPHWRSARGRGRVAPRPDTVRWVTAIRPSEPYPDLSWSGWGDPTAACICPMRSGSC